MLRVISESLADKNARDLINSLLDQLNAIPLIRGSWQFVTFTVSTATANYKFPHRLGFVPKDVIQLSVTGGGSITWNYSNFSSTQLDVTTAGGEVTVRAFVGTYQEG